MEEGYENKIKKTGNVYTTQQWGAFAEPLLLWKSNIYCVCL